MAIQLSDDVRNAMLEAIETTIGPSPRVRLYTGPPPANCAASATGTLLADFVLASDWAANAGSGSKTFNTVSSATGLATGDVGHMRICNSAGVAKEQCTVSEAGGGGDAIIDNKHIVIGAAVDIPSFVWNMPGG
jgi:hypothetical protein